MTSSTFGTSIPSEACDKELTIDFYGFMERKVVPSVGDELFQFGEIYSRIVHKRGAILLRKTTLVWFEFLR